MAVHRVGIFGGTFDPVHTGHLHVASRWREELDLDLVVFIPCRRSPHKEDAPLAPDSARLHMLTLALSGHSWALCSTLETDRPPPSYSWVTAEAIHEIYPDARLYWLMGSDQWDVLPAWNRPHYLAELVDFAVFHRGSPPLAHPGLSAHFLAGEHPASASHIRSALATGTPPKWLDPKVEQFILERGLYQGNS